MAINRLCCAGGEGRPGYGIYNFSRVEDGISKRNYQHIAFIEDFLITDLLPFVEKCQLQTLRHKRNMEAILPAKLHEIDFDFSDLDVGAERYVRCAWSIHILRQHVFRADISEQTIQKFDEINQSLGIAVESVNLNEYQGIYRTSDRLNSVINESEYPKWVWFYDVEALKDTGFAGWLRNRLTVRHIENLRVVFITESRDEFREVFCNRRTPLYQSTMLLHADMFTR